MVRMKEAHSVFILGEERQERLAPRRVVGCVSHTAEAVEKSVVQLAALISGDSERRFQLLLLSLMLPPSLKEQEVRGQDGRLWKAKHGVLNVSESSACG